METQIKAFFQTPQGTKFVTLFGYASKGVPSLEINGVGKLSKNIKEKIIFLTRTRRLKIPLRRFVVCVDINELNQIGEQYLKSLEFPILLLYWYLCNLIPIRDLNDCLTSGWVKANGEIYQEPIPASFNESYKQYFNFEERRELKLIGPAQEHNVDICLIESALLLEHIEKLDFRIDCDSSYIEDRKSSNLSII